MYVYVGSFLMNLVEFVYYQHEFYFAKNVPCEPRKKEWYHQDYKQLTLTNKLQLSLPDLTLQIPHPNNASFSDLTHGIYSFFEGFDNFSIN